MAVERYQVIDEIGGGGMGRVRLARSLEGRLVVLKTAIHEDDEERLRDEGRVGLRVKHPGLVDTIEVFDAVEHGRAHPVLVTAYLPGTSLIELRRLGTLHPAVVCRFGRELAEALAALHEATGDDGQALLVIHRDVTAANCLVGHDGHARLIDLGIARSREGRALRTETGVLRGTLRYLAPELFDGGAYSVQSDLWSLGVVLWEALLGRVAIVGNDAVAIDRVLSGAIMVCDDAERPDPVAAAAVGRLLGCRPAARPATAREAATLLGDAERTLSGGDDVSVDAAVQAALRRIVRPDDGAAELVLREASRNFRGDDSAPGGVNAWPAPAPDVPNPRFSLRDHAARLLAMEHAYSTAWEQETKRLVGGVRLLPVDTPPASEGATVLLELPATFDGGSGAHDVPTRRRT